jgi:hypothetical protein
MMKTRDYVNVELGIGALESVNGGSDQIQNSGVIEFIDKLSDKPCPGLNFQGKHIMYLDTSAGIMRCCNCSYFVKAGSDTGTKK